EAEGLAWRCVPDARGRARADREWLVPVELRDAPRSNQPSSSVRSLPKSVPGAPPAAPELRVIDRLPGAIRPGPSLPRIVRDLDQFRKDRSDEARPPRADLLGFAEHCGVALGVWIQEKRVLRPGPRATAWQQLTTAERVRALARLWLVDDRSPRHVPTHLRRALWQVLRVFDENTWYDVNSLARRVAWQVAFAGTRRSDGPQPIRDFRRRGSMTRRDLETAIEVL